MNVNGKTRVLGLIGDPVEHTMSPLIHNTLSDALGLNNIYVPFHVKAEGLADAIRGAGELNILGLNVTVPHKNDVMANLVEVDDLAAAIGAVNTLVRVDGGYKGYNTDMMGLARQVKGAGVNLNGKDVVILGAGGAAKAVAFMCANEGAGNIFILNRTVAKAEEIATGINNHFGKDIATAFALSDYSKIPAETFVAFQSTSIGLYPNVEDVVIFDEAFYKKVEVGFDLVYKPFETSFMKMCKAAGAEAHNGLRMLLYQGVIAYELWKDISVSEELAETVYQKLATATKENIILIGFMGAGKTTVGKKLAKELGFAFLDTDHFIEEKQGCTIKEIFAQKGEEEFRRIETEALKTLNASTTKTVIATGGGVPLREENVAELKKLGKIIFLTITADEVYNRLRGDTSRPLLAGENPKEKIDELLTARMPKYEAAADITISVVGKFANQIANEILSIQGERNV